MIDKLDELFNKRIQYYWCRAGGHYWYDLVFPKYAGEVYDAPIWVAENSEERYCGCLEDEDEN